MNLLKPSQTIEKIGALFLSSSKHFKMKLSLLLQAACSVLTRVYLFIYFVMKHVSLTRSFDTNWHVIRIFDNQCENMNIVLYFVLEHEYYFSHEELCRQLAWYQNI